MKTKFYEFNQNNSGGSFIEDDQLCHRIIIEAQSESEATRIAESLGCYWDGVSKGIDCDCCGDRWYGGSEVDIEKINKKWGGLEYNKWLSVDANKEEELTRLGELFPAATWSVQPSINTEYSTDRLVGKMLIDSIETYAQIYADMYGWTTPDCRIFYTSSDVKEIFKNI